MAALAGMALALVELTTEEPDDATDSDRLPDGLAGTWERRTPDGRMEATIADGAIEVVRVSGDSREVLWRGVYEAKGREWVVREAPKESHTANMAYHDPITDYIIFRHHPVGRFRAGTHSLLQGKETVMCNDIDFRKAVRLMEEARDRLDEASEILGVFDSGDMSGRNTIADKAWSIDQDIDGIKAIAERMGEEI